MNYMRRKIITTLFALAASLCAVLAQHDYWLTMERFSRVGKNPAGIVKNDEINLFLHGRYQWAGVDNSPKTLAVSLSDYEDKIKSGFGITLSHDVFGVAHSNTGGKLSYSFQIGMGQGTVLSLGVAAGFHMSRFDFSANITEEYYEYESALYERDKEVMVSPDFDCGAELRTKHWIFGVSSTHIQNSEGTTEKGKRHIYTYGIATYPLNPKLDLSPSICYMHRNKTNVMEVGALLLSKRSLWGGAAWRPDLNNSANPSPLSFTLGYEWNRFRFGYTYEMGLGSNSHLPSNTHEILLYGHFGKIVQKNECFDNY